MADVISTVTFVLGVLYLAGKLPQFVSERTFLFNSWSQSDRMFLSSLLTLCFLPLFLCLLDHPISKGLMAFGLILEFSYLYFRSDEKMHEDLVPGYKQEKERRTAYKMNLRLRKALRREQRAMLQACDKKGWL